MAPVVGLPAELTLDCPWCHAQFKLAAVSVSGVAALFCPLCGRQFELYDGMPPQLRRKVYHAIRDSIEQRVAEQQQMDREGYFEDKSNLPDES